MKRLLWLSLCAALSIPLCASTLRPYSASNPIRLGLAISSESDDVHSAIRREARKRSDVSLVDNRSTIFASIIVNRIKVAGDIVGYSASLALTRPLDPMHLTNALVAKDKFMTAAIYLEPHKDAVDLLCHTLFTGADIDALAKQIVTAIDRDGLEPERRRAENLVNRVMEFMSSKPGSDKPNAEARASDKRTVQATEYEDESNMSGLSGAHRIWCRSGRSVG